MSNCDFNYLIWLPTGPTGPSGPMGILGPTGPTGFTPTQQSIIFDGGFPETDYSKGASFDCGTAS